MPVFYWNWAYKYSDPFQMNVSCHNGYPEKELMQQHQQKYLYIIFKDFINRWLSSTTQYSS